MSINTAVGSCLCGTVVFEFTLPTVFAGHCHCTMCQRAHGAGFVTWIGVREDGFRITKGAGEVEHFKSSPHTTRSFCRRCGSSMFCNNDTHENLIDITLANVHGKIDREIKAHFYNDCRAPWTDVNDDLKKLGGESGTEAL
ncbi:MAG: GFA family protein [Alphaproteobacteria bacterium]|nr:GFA family protein [Alphaproteobacteria bacterium]